MNTPPHVVGCLSDAACSKGVSHPQPRYLHNAPTATQDLARRRPSQPLFGAYGAGCHVGTTSHKKPNRSNLTTMASRAAVLSHKDWYDIRCPLRSANIRDPLSLADTATLIITASNENSHTATRLHRPCSPPRALPPGKKPSRQP
jgi:hypothetical protein